MRTALYILGGVALFLGILFAYDRSRVPTPVKELLPADAGVDLSVYEGSMPSSAGSPAVLILGSSHLAQSEQKHPESAFDRVTDTLAAFAPDVVAVEYLPADYPRGKGRDYRPVVVIDQGLQVPGVALDRLLRPPGGAAVPGQGVGEHRLLSSQPVELGIGVPECPEPSVHEDDRRVRARQVKRLQRDRAGNEGQFWFRK